MLSFEHNNTRIKIMSQKTVCSAPPVNPDKPGGLGLDSLKGDRETGGEGWDSLVRWDVSQQQTGELTGFSSQVQKKKRDSRAEHVRQRTGSDHYSAFTDEDDSKGTNSRFSHPGLADKTTGIWVWGRCRRCHAQSPEVLLSTLGYDISFGHFLNLLFNNDRLLPDPTLAGTPPVGRGPGRGCQHDAMSNRIWFFRLRGGGGSAGPGQEDMDIVTSLERVEIRPRKLVVPSHVQSQPSDIGHAWAKQFRVLKTLSRRLVFTFETRISDLIQRVKRHRHIRLGAEVALSLSTGSHKHHGYSSGSKGSSNAGLLAGLRLNVIRNLTELKKKVSSEGRFVSLHIYIYIYIYITALALSSQELQRSVL